jgi:hypothetical protein
LFGLCTSNNCLFTITIVSYRSFILSDPITLVAGCEEIPKITVQDTRMIISAAAACDGKQQSMLSDA